MSNTAYSPLKAGIVGAGLMGRWHSSVIQRLGVQTACILDTNHQLALQLSAKLKNNPAVFSSLDEMLSCVQLDVLHICTPVESHYPIAMAAIDAGVHVVVEKPLATSVDKTQSLLTAATAKNVKVCPVHQFGFQAGTQKAISHQDSLGELLHLRFTTGSAGASGQTQSALNDVIADIIPHPLSVLQRIRPNIKLDTRQWSGVHSRKGELQLIGEANGIGIDIYISMNTRPTRCEMELFFTDGRIVLNFFHGYALIEKGKVSRIQKLVQPFKYALNQLFVAGLNISKRSLMGEHAYPGLYSLISEFYSSVKNNTVSPIAAEDILNVAIARDNLVGRFLK
ncbi:hypothetical protein MNBD_GAMMA23-357 [hydrothermal vent metagenome]|uniref:Gfo/Idh/MocA-like oxidoreductase N-terminal domain-containing protein n=1 Tax=hydrothermal vent metagenome TaxID=652676 RepID=A0A3B0ZH30_9ZZZZ